MDKFILERPNDVAEALSKGKKLMIFEVDEDKKPVFPISEIIVKKFDVFPENREILKPALNYIREKYNKEIRLDMLADLCDLSISYFCRLFKEETGTGAGEYVIRLRLSEACRLLETTDNSVVQISFGVGYADCGYFNKSFKKRFGMTPLEYRKSKR